MISWMTQVHHVSLIIWFMCLSAGFAHEDQQRREESHKRNQMQMSRHDNIWDQFRFVFIQEMLEGIDNYVIVAVTKCKYRLLIHCSSCNKVDAAIVVRFSVS